MPRADYPSRDQRTNAAYMLVPVYDWRNEIRAWVKVDVDVYEALGKYRWSLKGKERRPYVQIYVAVGGGRYGGRGHYLTLHRHLMGCVTGDGIHVDHLNRDTLDNRRVNLHPGTPSENIQNQAAVWGTSRFRGVFWITERQRWAARVKLPGSRPTHLGYFDDEDEAGRVAAEFRAKHMPHSPEALAAAQVAGLE